MCTHDQILHCKVLKEKLQYTFLLLCKTKGRTGGRAGSPNVDQLLPLASQAYHRSSSDGSVNGNYRRVICGPYVEKLNKLQVVWGLYILCERKHRKCPFQKDIRKIQLFPTILWHSQSLNRKFLTWLWKVQEHQKLNIWVYIYVVSQIRIFLN